MYAVWVFQGPSQTYTERKKWVKPFAREAPQNLGFLFNISATTKGSDFKIGRLVGFAKAHRKKTVWLWARGAPKNLGFSL